MFTSSIRVELAETRKTDWWLLAAGHQLCARVWDRLFFSRPSKASSANKKHPNPTEQHMNFAYKKNSHYVSKNSGQISYRNTTN
jgi:hypothetical protein